MTERDISVVKMPGDVRTYTTEDRTTSGITATLKPGEPVMLPATGADYVVLITNGAPVQNSDEFVGIVAKESTEAAATTEGEVEVITIIPAVTVLRGKGSTTTDIDTAAKIKDYLNDWVTFDNTAGVFAIDENEGSDSTNNGLKIVGGDHIEYTVDVIVHAAACEAAAAAGG